MSKQIVLLPFVICILLAVLGIERASAQIQLGLSDTTVCKGSMVHNYATLSPEMDSVLVFGHEYHFGDYFYPAGWDNVSYPSLPLGFSFMFFGKPYTDFRVAANNFINLCNGPGYFLMSTHYAYSGLVPHINNYYKTALMLGMQDLNSILGGAIRAQWLGAPGSKRLVVEYCRVAQENNITSPIPPNPVCDTNRVTNQIILYEGSNIIEIHTKHLPGSTICPGNNAYYEPQNSAVQGLYYYDDTTGTALEVYSPGRGPGDGWGLVGAQYTARRFSPIATAPYYQVDTIPYAPWPIIDTVDSTAFYWYNAQGQLVAQGPTLSAVADAAAGADSTFFVVEYLGPAGCDTVAGFKDTFWVYFAERDTTVAVWVCEGSSYSYFDKELTAPSVYDTVLQSSMGCDSTV